MAWTAFAKARRSMSSCPAPAKGGGDAAKRDAYKKKMEGMTPSSAKVQEESRGGEERFVNPSRISSCGPVATAL